MNLSEVSKLTEEEARATYERIRWPNGPVCPHCGNADAETITRFRGKAHRVGVLKCNECGEQFSATVGPIMEGSHLPIRLWLMAFALLCSSKKGLSALQLQRQLGLGSYRTAWHMAMRIRYAMKREPLAGLLSGTVEVDEKYVGGKPRPGSGNTRTGRGTKKVPVVALVDDICSLGGGIIYACHKCRKQPEQRFISKATGLDVALLAILEDTNANP
jgi:transposase-like protein